MLLIRRNLSEKGVHEVSQRRFVLVAADHPIVSAISENADKLQAQARASRQCPNLLLTVVCVRMRRWVRFL